MQLKLLGTIVSTVFLVFAANNSFGHAVENTCAEILTGADSVLLKGYSFHVENGKLLVRNKAGNAVADAVVRDGTESAAIVIGQRRALVDDYGAVRMLLSMTGLRPLQRNLLPWLKTDWWKDRLSAKAYATTTAPLGISFYSFNNWIAGSPKLESIGTVSTVSPILDVQPTYQQEVRSQGSATIVTDYFPTFLVATRNALSVIQIKDDKPKIVSHFSVPGQIDSVVRGDVKVKWEQFLIATIPTYALVRTENGRQFLETWGLYPDSTLKRIDSINLTDAFAQSFGQILQVKWTRYTIDGKYDEYAAGITEDAPIPGSLEWISRYTIHGGNPTSQSSWNARDHIIHKNLLLAVEQGAIHGYDVRQGELTRKFSIQISGIKSVNTPIIKIRDPMGILTHINERAIGVEEGNGQITYYYASNGKPIAPGDILP